MLAGLFAAGAAAQGPSLTLAVTEGVTYQATPKEIRDKFAPLAEYIGKATGRRVKVVLVPAYDDLRAGLAKQEYDLAFVHPAHVAMAADQGRGVTGAIAWTSGFTEYTVSLLTKAGAPLKTLGDLRGNTIVTPDPDSITAVMVRAMFRTGNLTTPTRSRRRDSGARDHHALPGRGAVLPRQRLRPGRRDRGEGRRQGVDRQGRQGADAVARGADQADHRVDADVPPRSRTRSAKRCSA